MDGASILAPAARTALWLIGRGQKQKVRPGLVGSQRGRRRAEKGGGGRAVPRRVIGCLSSYRGSRHLFVEIVLKRRDWVSWIVGEGHLVCDIYAEVGPAQEDRLPARAH